MTKLCWTVSSRQLEVVGVGVEPIAMLQCYRASLQDPAKSVVDRWCRSHDVKNLWIVVRKPPTADMRCHLARHHRVDPDDHRAVDVELTPRGRTLWREMNVTYRRSVQERFAARLDDDRVAAIDEATRLIDPVAEEL